MCGIAGIVSLRGVESRSLVAMAAALRHRGPDGYGYALCSADGGLRVMHNSAPSGVQGAPDVAGLAHLRLSILDLSPSNAQPMMDEASQYCLAYNGEIYNYMEIRSELERLGHRFLTTGDTEVVLHAYIQWGPDCVQRFNGMWAFALVDSVRRRVVLSRDRFGIKPLYYALSGGAIYFASEIKSLLAVPGIGEQPNERAVAEFLLSGAVDRSQETFYEGVFQFPAAHWAEIDIGAERPEVRPHRYWQISTEASRLAQGDVADRFKALLVDSVLTHIWSDVPVGTCLSGGLDSSSIVCIASELRRSRTLRHYTHAAFGYCPPDERYSERRYMQAVVQATAARMHYVEFGQAEFEEALPQIIADQDEPFGSASIVAQWFVFRRAKNEGITVMLDGQGADEVLAGYHSYLGVQAQMLLRRHEFARYLGLVADYQRHIGPFPHPLRPLVRAVAPEWLLQVYRGVRDARAEAAASLPPHAAVLQSAMVGLRVAEQEADASCLGDVLRAAVESIVLPALLRYEDRNSMAHSIEARVPFLDHRLVEYAFSLPDSWRIRGAKTKYVLREAMRGILPESIRGRHDKIGFKPSPGLTFAFAERHFDALAENRTECERRWFDADGVRATLGSQARSVNAEFALWRIVNTKLWARQHWGSAAEPLCGMPRTMRR